MADTENEDGGQEEVKPHLRLLRSKGFIPTVVVVALGAFVLASPRMSGSPPRLDALTPAKGRPGTVIDLVGRNFGSSQETSEVRIAGTSPTSSEIKDWSDSRITLTVPQDATSGLVYVITKNGRSTGLLFTNQDEIPQPALTAVRPGDPYIWNNEDNPIQPSASPVGGLITIYGLNFGLEKGSSEVFFTPSGQQSAAAGSLNTDDMLPAAASNDDYVSWSDREIVLHVPDGAASGNLIVRSDKGESNGRYFVVNKGAGAKTYSQPRGYHVQYGLTVTVGAASGENTLYVWMPRIFPGPEQRSIVIVSVDPAPLLDTTAASLYSFTNMTKGGRYRVDAAWMFNRYAESTQVSVPDVPAYDTESDLYKHFTAADALVNPGAPEIVKAAATAVGAEKNPWLRARRIYDALLALLTPGPAAGSLDAAQATLKSRRGNAEGFAALYCALLRSAGIPSRVVAGYLVADDLRTVTRHYWDELYVDTVGWVPVDPFLADGGAPTPSSAGDGVDPRAFYFGSLDNQHITLSKGLTAVSQMNPAGHVKMIPELPYLLSMHEEAVGALTSYTAGFEDLTITGTY